MKQQLYPTIGFEIHIELATQSKMFCGCPADHFGKPPNTQTCPVCLGLPGALPVPQKKAIEWTMMIGMALNCQISKESRFDRKHYFYPDLPKGYQISQYDQPFCTNGYLDTSEGRVRINRVHLEEDTGKLVHKCVKGKMVSLVDFNRSGVPLVEIVTEPDIKTANHGKEYAKQLREIIRYLGVSECDMEKGSMRLEANISLGLNFGYKVEVKNVNSFKFIGKAIDYELERQTQLLKSGITPIQETRGWDEAKRITKSQRVKETSADYRYFPEPDIPPFSFTENEIEAIRNKLPKLPEQFKEGWKKEGIKEEYLNILIKDKKLFNYASSLFPLVKKQTYDLNEIASFLINKKVDYKTLTPDEFLEKVNTIKTAIVTDELAIESWVDEAISSLPKVVNDVKSGKSQAIGVLVGKVMQLSKGKADPNTIHKLLQKKLG